MHSRCAAEGKTLEGKCRAHIHNQGEGQLSSTQSRVRARRTVDAFCGLGGAAATLLCALALAIVPSAARAGTTGYCGNHPGYGWLSPGGGCEGPAHSLRQSRADHLDGSTMLVGAGATDLSLHAYGSVVYDTDGSVCHSYSGLNTLYADAYNNSGVYSQLVEGTEYWGSEPACP